jgi:F-box/leucine-rich repeat protein 2/20
MNMHAPRLTQVTDVGAARIAAECPRLQSLDLSHCPELTDVGLAKLAAGCVHLRRIDLQGCYKITDAAVMQTVRSER